MGIKSFCVEALELRRLLSGTVPRLDSGFGDGGTVQFRVPVGSASQIVRGNDGSIIAAGYGEVGNVSEPVIEKYLANGRLDTSFGNAGRVMDPGGLDGFSSVAVQPDGKVDVLGDTELVQLLSNGKVNQGFGVKGVAQLPTLKRTMSWRAQAALPDGQVILLGNTFDDQPEIEVLVKLNADATIDKTFGANGVVTLANVSTNSIIARPDGRLIVMGNTVEQFHSDGTVDAKFGNGGIAKVPNTVQEGGGGALQADGSLVIGGYDDSGLNLALVRINTHGKLDHAFGNGGLVKLNFNGLNNSSDTGSDPSGLAIGPDNSIVVGAEIDNPVNSSGDIVGVARFTADGELDPSFGSGGRSVLAVGSGVQGGNVIVQPDDKIIVGGNREGASEFLARLKVNGSFDASFGNGGLAGPDPNGQVLNLEAMAIQSDGKIVAVGSTLSVHDGPDVVVARFNANGSNDKTFGTDDGRAVVDLGGTESANAVAIGADGKIVVAVSTDHYPALMRFDANGTLDKTFGHNGVLTKLPGAVAALAIQKDGKILIGGAAPWLVERLNVDGSVDSSYGKKGVSTFYANVVKPKGHETFAVDTMRLDSSGRLLIGGAEDVGSEIPGDRLVAARINTDGKEDRTFGTGGAFYSDLMSEDDFIDLASVVSIATGAKGAIFLAGDSGVGGVLAKLTSNGQRDSQFGNSDAGFDGFTQFPGDASALQIAVDKDGKIVGFADDDGETNALVRFNADGSFDNSFGEEGILDLNYSDTFVAMSLQGNGRILLAGSALDQVVQ